MKLCKVFFIGVLLSHYTYAEEVSAIFEEVHSDQLPALYEYNSKASAKDYGSFIVSFDGNAQQQFVMVFLPAKTDVRYSKTVTCNGIYYPTILLNTDSSYEDRTYAYTSNSNRLYIYDVDLNLIKYDKSNYSFSVNHNSGNEILDEHRFTLDNLETFTCNQIKRELSPISVEKAFSSNKIYSQRSLKKGYSEYSIGKIKAMFEAYPLSKRNVTQYNNIAYYFEKHKAFEQSVFVLEKVLDQYPTRTVAYINLGDAYWSLDKRIKAKAAYQKYVELMKANEKEHKIPQKVLERVES